jgi:hypothetical protein
VDRILNAAEALFGELLRHRTAVPEGLMPIGRRSHAMDIDIEFLASQEFLAPQNWTGAQAVGAGAVLRPHEGPVHAGGVSGRSKPWHASS